MGFFRSSKSRPGSGTIAGISAQDLAEAEALRDVLGTPIEAVPLAELEELLAPIAETIVDKTADPLSEAADVAIQTCFPTVFGRDRASDASGDDLRWITALSRIGYVTRVVEEAETDGDASQPQIAEALARVHRTETYNGIDWWACANRLAGEMASSIESPVIRSTWAVPGFGGGARAVLLEMILSPMIEDNCPPGGLTRDDLERAWLFGFTFRCAEASLPPGVAITD